MCKLASYLFIFALAAGICGCFPATSTHEPTLLEQPAIDLELLHSGQKAQVLFVIDGDTIEVDLHGKEYRVRYIGVDSPERDEPFYKEAAGANRALVEDQEIILVRDVSETDRFGRLLRYIYLPDGTFVNAELILQGYGRIVTFPPDVAQTELFAELQREARENQRGLWGLSEMQALPSQCTTCNKNAHNCQDFDTQAAAQACYITCLEQIGEDVHHLDGGGDGIVCESLP
jgi:endonuclease YncB( thermonuclease family)